MKITFAFSQNLDPIKDQLNINIVYKLLEKGECNVSLNVKFKTKLGIKENGFLSTEVEKPHFRIMDKDINFEDKILYIGGKIDKISEVSKDSDGLLNYKLLLSNTIMSFTKNSN